ncbi:MAG: hypothetical protein HYU71_12975 [Bacteroidetes bacterium]|nr:hypothetical protein [Bacteroidota bacterium]
MMMKQFFNSLLLICCLVFTTQAQPADAPSAPASQNIIGLKMAFVTKQLALTNDEAQKFWPVYYGYTAELRKLRQNKKEDVLAMEEDMLNLRKKYRSEFKKILNTDERVNKALTVDRDFMIAVRKELQQRRSKVQRKQ